MEVGQLTEGREGFRSKGRHSSTGINEGILIENIKKICNYITLFLIRLEMERKPSRN